MKIETKGETYANVHRCCHVHLETDDLFSLLLILLSPCLLVCFAFLFAKTMQLLLDGQFFVHRGNLCYFLRFLLLRLLLVDDKTKLLANLQSPFQQVSEFLFTENLKIFTAFSDFICGVLKTVQGRQSHITTDWLLEAELVVGSKNRDRVSLVNELSDRKFLELGVVALFITFTLSLLLFRIEDLGLIVRGGRGKFCKNMLWVEELRINALGGLVSATDNENFSGNISR